MKGIFVCFSSTRTYIDGVEDGESIGHCLERTSDVWDPSDWYLSCNGKLIKDTDRVECGQTYHVVPRLVGGKGGFGSMLRAIGAQIEKTTNREACRDLSGRRMRDVNNEKKLREWVSKAAEREKEKEQRRKDRWARLRAVPKHKFEDPQYHEQKQKVLENMQESLNVGLQKAVGTDEPSTSAGPSLLGKRKAPPSAAAGSAKKSMSWIGIDLENASDLSSDESDDENSKSSSASGRLSENASENEKSDDQSNEKCDSDAPNLHPEASIVDTEVAKSVESDDKSSNSTHTEGSNSKDSLNSSSETSVMNTHQNEVSQSTSEDSESDKVAQVSKEKKSGLLAALSKVPPKEDKKEEKQEKTVVEYIELDLMTFDSIQDLEAQGLDALKANLQARGLKCGGTLAQRAERLWSVRGLTPDQYPANLKAKPAKK